MELVLCTEEEQYQYEQEKALWNQSAATIGKYITEPLITPTTYNEFLFSPLGQSNDSLDFIRNLQNESLQVPISVKCGFEILRKNIGVEDYELFRKDYEKFKGAVYIADSSIKNTKSTEDVKDFLKEMQTIEIKKEAQHELKEVKAEIGVNIEKNTEETNKLEEWLDDLLT